jgi:hypothetical protein
MMQDEVDYNQPDELGLTIQVMSIGGKLGRRK